MRKKCKEQRQLLSAVCSLSDVMEDKTVQPYYRHLVNLLQRLKALFSFIFMKKNTSGATKFLKAQNRTKVLSPVMCLLFCEEQT